MTLSHSVTHTRTCFHTTSGLSSHTPGARKEAGYTLCTSTQSSWTRIHSHSCQLPPVPASEHTHTHRHTLAQSLASGHLAFPLTCNFRHRCAGRTHTRATLRHDTFSDAHVRKCHMFNDRYTHVHPSTPPHEQTTHKHTTVSPSAMYAASCKSLR